MTSDRPRILQLQHVSLPFPGTPESMAEVRRFYAEVLGFTERPAPPTLPGTIWFTAGGDALELHVYSEPSGVAVNHQSTRHPCFLVDDVKRFRAHLDANGVETIDHDGDIPGRPRFFARDPFGNAIEFVQFLPGHW